MTTTNDLRTAPPSPDATPLLTARGIVREYPPTERHRAARKAGRKAVDGVDIDVFANETVAIIGESGSGKSTLVRILLGLDRATSGEVQFAGEDVRAQRAGKQRWLRRRTGIVLQDPYASLDPRQSVRKIIAEPLQSLGVEGDHDEAIEAVLQRVGLEPWRAEQYPHELSGGQRQRVALARAIVHRPDLLIGDEPLSALDVTIRARMLALLRSLKADREMSMILVSHDIALVRHFADRVYVMKDGRVVEHGDTSAVLAQPQHAYTRQLLAAVPRLPR